MLSPAERERIRTQGYCSYHDVPLWCLTEGEPFLDDDLLYYFDGRRLFLCGYPLEREASSLKERIQAIARKCYSLLPVELLVYCGPQSVSFRRACPNGHRLVGTRPADDLGAELVVDCTKPPTNRRLRRWLRSTRRASVEIRVRQGGTFDFEAAQRLIVEKFFSRREITPYLLDIAFVLPALTRSDHVFWLDAICGGKVCGLAVVSDAFAQMDLGLFIAAQPDTGGISDCLYAAILDLARKRGKRFVNLGPSPSPGSYWYKQKWGAQPLVRSYWFSQWACRELARSVFNSWPSRLLQFDFRPAELGPSLQRLKTHVL